MNRTLSFFLFIFVVYFAYEIYSLDKFYFLSPIEYRDRVIIRKDDFGDGEFGSKRRGSRKHRGVDLLAKVGTPIRTPKKGRVEMVGFCKGFGNYIKIQHSKDLKTAYGHLQKIFVRRGQRLRQGEIIGLVGKTGNASHRGILPHLHFEVKERESAVDPLGRYLD